jgi:hypothetical protein
MTFRAHDVPMCPQRIDPAEWHARGGTAPGDIEEWSDRACGMAASRMILLARRLPAQGSLQLVCEGAVHEDSNSCTVTSTRIPAGPGSRRRSADHHGGSLLPWR